MNSSPAGTRIRFRLYNGTSAGIFDPSENVWKPQDLSAGEDSANGHSQGAVQIYILPGK
jgi:hypothetical protein